MLAWLYAVLPACMSCLHELCESEECVKAWGAAWAGRFAACRRANPLCLCWPAPLPGHGAHTTLLLTAPHSPACPPQLDIVAYAFLAMLFCMLLSLAPVPLRQQLHLWLLTMVARAPLMLQPLLLLCPPARKAYRQCRCVEVLGGVRC